MDDILIIILIFYVSSLLVSCAIPEMDEVLCKTNNYYCAGLFK